jgi:formylglycine-generating enzyme required for sulfatase activity
VGRDAARAAQASWAAYLGRPAEEAVDLGGGVRMALALIPPGRFLMGTPEGEAGNMAGEGQREVELTRPFYLAVSEMTQGQYAAVTGASPSYFAASGEGKDRIAGQDTRKFPVDGVSWDDAAACAEALTRKLGGAAFRLPTEAEWEYACRAGTRTAFHFGGACDGTQANVDGTGPYGTPDKGPYLERPTPVGSFAPNAWGLFDMHGNVWEWCADWSGSPSAGKATDPTGPAAGTGRVVRGGSWRSYPAYCRSASRAGEPPDNRGSDHNHGFRLARGVAPAGQ